MNAFFIATAQIKDPHKLQKYVEKAIASIELYKGRLVLKGDARESLSGDNVDHDFCVVFQFPNMELLNQWHSSKEYQSLIPLRKEAINAEITTYETQ